MPNTAHSKIALANYDPRWRVIITQASARAFFWLGHHGRRGGARAAPAQRGAFVCRARGAAKCHAAFAGKYSPDIENVRAVALPILRHRIVRNYKAEAEGITVEKLVEELV